MKKWWVFGFNNYEHSGVSGVYSVIGRFSREVKALEFVDRLRYPYENVQIVNAKDFTMLDRKTGQYVSISE